MGLIVLSSLLTAGSIYGIGGVAVVGLIWWRVDRARAKARAQRLYSDLKNEETIAPLIEAVINGEIGKLTQADFDRLDLLNSNLFPQIKAVEFHEKQGKLRDIWMLSTESYETKEGKVKVKGSEDSALILSQYLRFLYGKTLDINSEGLSVRDYDYQGLWRLAEQIFRDSGYKDEVIVADITGGTKMMSVALAMACIPPKRRMQYMDSQRDWEGNPVSAGDMQPVVIDVDPILYV